MVIEEEPTRPEPAFRMVARQLESKILAGEIPPGDHFPSEVKIAQLLNVNRSTVREAIRSLEQSGLVRRESGRKKLIATVPKAGEISRRLSAAMILEEITFEELYGAVYALEPAAAFAAAQRRDDADLRAFEANLAATRQALANNSSLTSLDIEFHELVAKAARNRAIQLARSPLSELFYPAYYTVMSRLNAGQRLLFAHESIYAAVRDRDEKGAVNWMQKHIADFRRGFELANLGMSSPIHVTNLSAVVGGQP